MRGRKGGHSSTRTTDEKVRVDHGACEAACHAPGEIDEHDPPPGVHLLKSQTHKQLKEKELSQVKKMVWELNTGSFTITVRK